MSILLEMSHLMRGWNSSIFLKTVHWNFCNFYLFLCFPQKTAWVSKMKKKNTLNKTEFVELLPHFSLHEMPWFYQPQQHLPQLGSPINQHNMKIRVSLYIYSNTHNFSLSHSHTLTHTHYICVVLYILCINTI